MPLSDGDAPFLKFQVVPSVVLIMVIFTFYTYRVVSVEPNFFQGLQLNRHLDHVNNFKVQIA